MEPDQDDEGPTREAPEALLDWERRISERFPAPMAIYIATAIIDLWEHFIQPTPEAIMNKLKEFASVNRCLTELSGDTNDPEPAESLLVIPAVLALSRKLERVRRSEVVLWLDKMNRAGMAFKGPPATAAQQARLDAWQAAQVLGTQPQA